MSASRFRRLHWHPRHAGLRRRLSPAVWSRLTDRGSLTQQVRCDCSGQFSLAVLRHEFGRPTPEECQQLGIRDGELALIREVQLRCDGQPWIFAHTVIPRRSLRGRSRYLGRLGTRPLGAALFADPTMSRGALQLTELQPEHQLFRQAATKLAKIPKGIPGRRSRFVIAGHPLLVAEFFVYDWQT